MVGFLSVSVACLFPLVGLVGKIRESPRIQNNNPIQKAKSPRIQQANMDTNTHWCVLTRQKAPTKTT